MYSALAKSIRHSMLAFTGLAVIAVGPAPAAATPVRAEDDGTVRVREGPLGDYLTDGQGRSLYLFKLDTDGKSHCEGDCAAAWPPLVTRSSPRPGTGVTESKMGTITRADDVTQVTYDEQPLYKFAQDKAAGDLKGQGVEAFGGLWCLVAPDGSALAGCGEAPAPYVSPSHSPSPSVSPSATNGSPISTPNGVQPDEPPAPPTEQPAPPTEQPAPNPPPED